MIESGKLNLEQLVEGLLWQHDCVILPDLGALITRENQAALNPATHIFKPKSKSIFFNPAISKTDGLLANHLSENFGVGYNDAVLMIDEAVNKIKATIKNGEKVWWDSVGQFFGSSDKTFFIPKVETNFLVETYGLLPIQLTPIAQQANKVIAETVVTPLAVEKKAILAAAAVQTTVVEKKIDYSKTEVQPELDKPNPLPNPKPVMKYLRWAVAAALVAALVVVGIRNEKRTYFTEQKAAIDFSLTDNGAIEAEETEIPVEDYSIPEENSFETFEEAVPEDAAPVTELSNQEIAPAKNDIPAEQESTTIEAPALQYNLENQYHIIIEKTLIKASVDQFLSKEGTYYLPIKNSFIHRVGVASSNNINELKELLESIKSQYPKAEIVDKVAYEKL